MQSFIHVHFVLLDEPVDDQAVVKPPALADASFTTKRVAMLIQYRNQL